MRISDWSSDVCSSDLDLGYALFVFALGRSCGCGLRRWRWQGLAIEFAGCAAWQAFVQNDSMGKHIGGQQTLDVPEQAVCRGQVGTRSIPADLRQRLWGVAVSPGAGLLGARRLQ